MLNQLLEQVQQLRSVVGAEDEIFARYKGEPSHLVKEKAKSVKATRRDTSPGCFSHVFLC